MRIPRSDAQDSARALTRAVVACRRCPRLVSYREGVSPRASFASQRYWRKPVPGFGDLNGRLLVLGLAPALHGGNRTGRVFTGDSSGRFLVRALYDAGFANNPISESLDDGLVYTDCYVTAAVKCVPPGDKPAKEEFENCSAYLDAEISMMKNLTAVLALGALSFRAYIDHLDRQGVDVKGVKFLHGGDFKFKKGPALYASYHPSPRNTNTGKLTQKMLVSVLRRLSREFETIREVRI
ncbi:MAG TPA: uracil-DNA glycosylase [Nitrososphaerales archaeon]|nr:uracil-DNA glycosylase [Nitrososphaerales archaeon]